jgi:hypothetical protein
VVPPPAGGGYAAPAGQGGSYGPGLSGSAWAERGADAEYDGPDAAYAAEAPAERRPSRRHAAPDTGTDIARYGLSELPTPEAPSYGATSYDNGYNVPGFDGQSGYDAQLGYDEQTGYDAQLSYDAQPGYDEQTGYDEQAGHGGYDQPGAAAWTSPADYDYADPAAQDQEEPGGYHYGPVADDRSTYGGADSPFFAQDASGGFLLDNDDPPPAADDPEPDQPQSNTYGRPASAQHGWAPRNHEPRRGR